MKKLLSGLILGIVLTLAFQYWQDQDYYVPREWHKIVDKLTPEMEDDLHQLESNRQNSHYYGGMPKSSRQLRILENIGFTVGYDEIRENPSWVCYRLFRITDPVSPKRPSRFSVDDRTQAKVSHEDYTNSGYDRGHMAPNYAIATRYGREAQLETFLMSNIVPQLGNLNRVVWRLLEEKIATDYAMRLEEVWITTGPIYDQHIEKLDAGNEIPDAFYKIIVDEHNGNLRALAFLIPETASKQPIDTFLTSIDQIEQLTGLDFFTELPDEAEDRFEAWIAKGFW